MATSNKLRALNRLPFDFQDGLKVGGVDVTALNQTFTPAGAGLVGFTPVGNLSAGNVQAALAELESEKVGFARLDDADGSSLVGYDGGTIQDVLDAVTGPNGAASVGYTPAGTGAVAMAVQEKLREVSSLIDDMTPAQRNAVKLGSVFDVTAAVQSVLDKAGFITVPPGVYTIGPVFVRSNTLLIFSPGAVLKASSGFGLNDRMLKIEGVTDVTIYGNYGVVQMLKSEYTTGEQRHAVNISGSRRVNIYNLIAKDSGGDGFYIGGDTYCEDVNLFDCIAENNRRQGLTITNVINCNIFGGHYKDTSGTAPEAGIDIESNLLPGYYLQNVNIFGVRTSNNKGRGILISPQSRHAPVSINVISCTSQYDGAEGGALAITAAMAYRTVAPVTDPAHIGKIYGKITVRDHNILYPQGSGVVSVNWTENAPETVLDNIYVLNPGSNSELTETRKKCGVLVRGETPSSGTFGSSIGNLDIKGIRIEDNRASPVMYLPIYVEAADEATKPLKNLSISDIDVTPGQWTYASGVTPFAKTVGSIPTTDLSISYKGDISYINAATSISVSNNHIGLNLKNTGNINYTLPDASLFIGSTFSFIHTSAGNFQITPAAGDTILHYSPEAGVGIISRSVGSVMSLKAVSDNEWFVVTESGGWAAGVGYEPRYQQTSGTAAPTTGTWARGDIIWNYSPSAGGFAGWICVTAGTPGTWKTFGVISA